MKIELTKTEYNYFSRASFLPGGFQALTRSIDRKEDMYLINISEDIADTIRDLCGEELQRVGFDENYNLTPEGVILESLIDKFFI